MDLVVKTLPEKVIKSILRHCDGKTLLNLSSTCKEFRKHVLQSEEFIKKIRFVVNCANLDDSEVLARIAFAANFKFVFLRIQNVQVALGKADVTNGFLWLIERLGKTVKNLILSQSDVTSKQLNEVLSRQPNLTHITLFHSIVRGKSQKKLVLSKLIELVSWKSTGLSYFDNFKLAKLLLNSDDKATNRNEIDKFLQQQENLKELNIDLSHFNALNQTLQTAPKFQLKVFKIYRYQTQNVDTDLVRLNEFLSTQKMLETLRFYIEKKSLMESKTVKNVLSTICSMDKIHDVEVLLLDNISIQHDQIQKTIHELSKLKCRNKTVKKLTISIGIEDQKIVSSLINLFDSLEEINLDYASRNTVKISSKRSMAKFENFGVMKIVGDKMKTFEYLAESHPANRELFEENVGKFLKQNGKNVHKVSIGHLNWNSDENSSFKLTQTFCENLVNNLPNLEELELFAVTTGVLKWFNDVLETKSINVKLRNDKPPTGDEEPAAKRSKLEISF
jgi:hypothetical protein